MTECEFEKSGEFKSAVAFSTVVKCNGVMNERVSKVSRIFLPHRSTFLDILNCLESNECYNILT